jgi:O-antigen ligase
MSTRKSVSSRPRTLVLSVLVASLILLAVASWLVYPSSYSPLLFLGGIATIVTFIVWLAKPVWALYAALVLVFLPLGLIPANIHSLLNRSVTVIAVGVWFVNLLITRKKIVWTAPTLFMLLFISWGTITLLWAEKLSPAAIALQVYSLRFLLFLLLIPNEIKTKRDLDGLMKVLAIGGWVLMLSVVTTLLLQGYTPGSRLKVFDANENGVGLLALIGMVGVLWQAYQSSEKIPKTKVLTTAIYILLMFGLVAMSGSRGSALSLIVTLIVFWFWKPIRFWGKLGFLMVMLALIFTPSIFTTLIQRFSVDGRDTLLGGREVLWQAAWHIIQDNPIGGVGLGNAPDVVLRYLETDSRIVGVEKVVVHNPILTIWSETALPGILSYVGVLISAVYLFGKQYPKFKKQKHIPLTAYFAVISSVFFGYMISWIKGGGMESDFSYFLILALLTLPSVLDVESFDPVFSAH